METPLSFHYGYQLSRAVAKFGITAIVLPLVPVFLLGLSLPSTLILMTSTFILEYGAAPVGVGLGLNPFFVLFVLLCIAASVNSLLFDIFTIIGTHSVRVAEFLRKNGERARRSKVVDRYGIYGLIPLVWTLGIFACPPVSWVLGWDRTRSFVAIMAGFSFAAVVTTLASVGILKIFFP